MVTIHPGGLIGELHVSHELVLHGGPQGVVPLPPDVQQLRGAPRVRHDPRHVPLEFKVTVGTPSCTPTAPAIAAVWTDPR